MEQFYIGDGHLSLFLRYGLKGKALGENEDGSIRTYVASVLEIGAYARNDRGESDWHPGHAQ